MPMRLRYITTIENLIADIYVDEIQSDSIIDESDLFANTVTLDEKYEALTILQIEKENEFIGFLCCPATYNDGVFDYKYQPNSGIEVNLNAESKKVSEIKISQVDSGFWYETSLLRKGTRIYISNDSNAEISEEVNEYIKINYPSAKETDYFVYQSKFFVSGTLPEDYVIILEERSFSYEPPANRDFPIYAKPFFIVPERFAVELSKNQIMSVI